MPNEPEPRLEVPWRAAGVAGITVACLVALLGAAVWVLGAPGGTPSGGSPSVTTASPASVTTTGPAPGHHARHRHRHHVGAPLRPTRITHDPNCPVRPPHILRVLQFNIHAGVSRFRGIGLARIAAEIEAAKPDLVSLNEVDSHALRSGETDEAAYLGRATGLDVVYGPNLVRRDGGRFGNAILSRYPVQASHNLRLPRTAGTEPRGLLGATLKVGRRVITFYSVHLSQGHQGTGERIREAEAVAGVLRDATGPTILAGDLNSRPGDLPVRILRQYLLDAQEQGGTGAGNTVPEESPRSRFDYILYDNHFAALPGSTQVLASGSSDHRAVWTELVLRPRGQC